MNVIMWTQGERRVAGPVVNLAVLHQSIIQSVRFEGFTTRQDSKLCRQFCLTMFKLTCGGALPLPCPFNAAHVMNSPKPSMFFNTLLLPCIIDENENRVGLGVRLGTVCICEPQCFHIWHVYS